MLDEKKKKSKSRVVVGGESSRRVKGSGAAPDVGVSFYDQFPPDPPIVREAVVSEEARRRLEDEGTEADDKSEIISVVGHLSIGGGKSEGVTFEEAVGRACLLSETETALDTAGLSICWFSNFSISINFLLGCHTGQLFDPLS